jgi:hypothetical protein
MEASPRSERATLSRELSEFLVELSIALHRHSMYPSGHPALTPAIESVARRAERLLQDRPQIAFGVARRQLIIDGITTDPDQPVLRRLADGLHRHHIGAVSVMPGLDAQELAEALHALSAEADKDGPIGLKAGGVPNWPHVKLHPLTFDGLALVGDTPSGAGEAESEQASRGAELWIGLARAALASDGSESSAAAAEPSVVARAIDENSGRAEAYDQIIVGYLLQIARELKTASGETAEDLKRRTSRLIASLNPGTLRRLVNMGGNQDQRDQFVLDATHGMAVDAVLEIVKASADASGQTISHGLVRMLTKLATHAERGSDLTRPRADVELREQVSRLLEDWRLEDPNPEAYGRVLEHLSTAVSGDAPRPTWAVAAEPEPLRLVQMSIEAGAFGPLADKAIDQAINAGQLSGLLELIASPPEGAQAGADMILARLTRPENLKGLFSGDRVDLSGLNHLLPRLSVEGYEPLLEALGSSPSRTVRRRLLDLLGRTPVDITPLIMARLTDERWYVQRNMLMLLARSRTVPQTFSAVPWTQHADARVRSEAIRLQLAMPHERDVGVDAALNDPDPRIVHLGLTAIRDACPPALIDRVIDLALASDLGEDSRLLAVNSLARQRRPDVLEALLQLSIGGRSLLGRTRLLPKTPVLVAVIRALSTTWSDEPRASGVLAAAARSSDPELRQAVSAQAT